MAGRAVWGGDFGGFEGVRVRWIGHGFYGWAQIVFHRRAAENGQRDEEEESFWEWVVESSPLIPADMHRFDVISENAWLSVLEQIVSMVMSGQGTLQGEVQDEN